jgi:hypothetical protein
VGNGAVQVAYLHPNTVSHSFADSLMRLVAWDIAHEGRVIRTGGPYMFRTSAAGIVQARNDVAKWFLDTSDAEWLWMVDTDMAFAPDTVDRLVQAADPAERPIVGALCFGWRETSEDGMQGWITVPFPTVFGWGEKDDGGEYGFAMRPDYPINTLTQVAGTGAACLLIHRTVFEKLRAEYGDAWFDQVRYPSGTLVSEDLSFCYRCNTQGLPIFVHTGIRTTHHKQLWVGESEFWRRRNMPPATEEVAVIVPVMKRPQNAEPFMRSLRASTGLATVYAVADDADESTAAAWHANGANLVGYFDSEDKPGTFAQKANHGYAQTTEPWLFLVGDDVSFHPGWLDHAQHAAKAHEAKVIGTNDLANPRVTSGQHATHLLIRRDYIDSEGAGWDGPGVVAHQGYRHWYVDDEIVTLAKQRGVWAMAIGSAVEHFHPVWGTAAMDDVYQLGMSHAEADRKIFEDRCARYS